MTDTPPIDPAPPTEVPPEPNPGDGDVTPGREPPVEVPDTTPNPDFTPPAAAGQTVRPQGANGVLERGRRGDLG